MSSFSSLFNRINALTEAKVSPYASVHPSFGGITKKMRAGGLSSAPLDTIKFIRETLYYIDIIDDDELNAIKRASGFSGKKQALLSVLKAKQDIINQNSDEITSRIEETLDDFINGVGVNRSREEKYAAQAAAHAIAKEVRKAKSGKDLDDVLTDIVSDEKVLVASSLAKVLGEIRSSLGDEGFDIDEEALEEVEGFADRIDSIAKLKSFIKQIQAEPGYEKIAAYLSSIVKPVEAGLEDEEMVEDEEGDYRPEGVEGYDVNEDEYDEVMNSANVDEAEEGKYDDGDGKKERCDYVPCEDEEVVAESYTMGYLTEQVKKDTRNRKTVTEGASFKERMKPKTHWQLEELRRYGL